ncbi:MAG TPA: LLM class F420-dependent oxidoreductase [Acidimicrobiales bacterium]|jgi:F420-dependent oxidoreductase-like protein
MIRAGLQIPNFTYPGVAPDQLFEKVADLATTAEASGFDTVLVMDHFYQLPLLGQPDDAMFESYTLLAALAARTERVQLGTLVTGVTYRNPAILAKIVTSLDVVSKGRAFLGIGAAWFDVEHHALGVDFPPLSERYERLEEALLICRAMFRGEQPTIEGKHYQVRNAFNVPAPIRDGGPPILIGGSGEKKTMPLMARYADAANVIAGMDEMAGKQEALRAACVAEGRDIDTLNTTPLVFLVADETTEAAQAKRVAGLAARGMVWDEMDDAARAMLDSRMIVGDRDHATERLKAIIDAGYDGLVVNLPLDGADTTAVTRAGEILTDALA